MKMPCLSLIMCLVGTAGLMQAGPILYTLNFFTASGIAPASGSFDYDSTQPVGAQFTNFVVAWDGINFDLTASANSPGGAPAAIVPPVSSHF